MEPGDEGFPAKPSLKRTYGEAKPKKKAKKKMSAKDADCKAGHSLKKDLYETFLRR